MTDNATDLQRIRETVQLYFDGMYHSDVEKLKNAFHASAALMGYHDGNLAHIPLENWLEMVAARPAPAKNNEEYDMKLVSMDVTENVAVVKVRDLYMGLWFTDYLSLLKIEGDWVIVNKIFHHEPRP
ncbi:MAG: nuclear transport factor 2 family protein [Deltaproteobacteria bacterium]|nr:nuclear transport factor 2 family protein [Deltaproteobacteria bacterium]